MMGVSNHNVACQSPSYYMECQSFVFYELMDYICFFGMALIFVDVVSRQNSCILYMCATNASPTCLLSLQNSTWEKKVVLFLKFCAYVEHNIH